MYSMMMSEVIDEMSGVFMPRIYKTEEIRKMLLLKTRQSVLRYIKQGALKARKIGRDYIVFEKDLQDFLEGKGTSIEELTDAQMSLFGEEDR